jgi:hypothetical protein
LSSNSTIMNKKLLFCLVMLSLTAAACVAKHPKCAAYDKAVVSAPIK